MPAMMPAPEKTHAALFEAALIHAQIDEPILPFLDSNLRSRVQAAISRAYAGLSQFRGDGIAFRNREQRLPLCSDGYYREFTVESMFESGGRGPERIVIGAAGDAWYTPDHYAHFVRFR